MKLNPTLQKRAAYTFVAVTIFIYFSYLIQAVLVERVLYADGANFFVGLLSKNHAWAYFEDPKHIRLLVNVVNQLPVSIAIELGETNLTALKLLFGAGAFFAPVAFYCYALFLSYRAKDFRVFFFSSASLATSVIQSDIFILNQAVTSLAISWVILHYLLLDLRINFLDWAVILCLSAILLRSHESIIIWGGVFSFGAIAMWALSGKELRDRRRGVIAFIGSSGLLYIVFAVYWLAVNQIGEQTYSYLSLLTLLSPATIWQGNVRIGFLVIVALVSLVLVHILKASQHTERTRVPRLALTIVVALCLLLIVITGITAITNHEVTNPSIEYGYRFLVSFGSAFWMLMSVFVLSKNLEIEINLARLSTIIVSLGIMSASLWQISNNLQWATFTSSTSAVLSDSSQAQIEPTQIEKKLREIGAEDAYKYRWPWAWPVLGLSLQEGGEIEKIIVPESEEVYVQPPHLLPFVSFDGRGLYFFSEDFIESWRSN